MAERRMFAKSVVLADPFLDLPVRARNLYFYLAMMADDDGFVAGPKSIMRQVGAKEADMKRLVEAAYVYAFDSGPVVLRHWRQHNYIRGDRYKPTPYQKEKALLKAEEPGVYTLIAGIPAVDPGDTGAQTQGRVGQERKVQDSEGEGTAPPVTACVERIFEAYHRICTGLPKALSLTEKRRAAITALLEGGTAEEDFTTLFQKAQSSRFLKGENPRGWVAGLDWLLDRENMQKVLEGNYDDRRGSTVPMGATGQFGQAELDAIARILEEG